MFVDRRGDTDAIAVIARDARFRPGPLARWPAAIGKTIAEFEAETDASVSGLIGFCGARRSAYMEIDAVSSAAVEFRSIAFGNLSTGPIDCATVDSSMLCQPESWSDESFDVAGCLHSTGWNDEAGRKLRRETTIWAVVVTAPDHPVTTEMFRLPEDF
ncbi:hypothetical protein O7635_32360 [Asanoa sp. WMMD1127]|uniref:hypothetical protein n=1 Tax=Asanoa sp. WMMD1127 TaxID=3016107 RepID=UPI0024168B2F|nr:hypothetical protein [Asanoa sp. WMMD1127]MDG4826568.1 hypothetical protein [Asanoa sp. WMMD1127]